MLADALCVREVTRILVGRPEVESPESLAGNLGEVLVHIAHFGRERRGPLAPRLIIAEQAAVALELSATSGGVHDDPVDVR